MEEQNNPNAEEQKNEQPQIEESVEANTPTVP